MIASGQGEVIQRVSPEVVLARLGQAAQEAALAKVKGRHIGVVGEASGAVGEILEVEAIGQEEEEEWEGVKMDKVRVRKLHRMPSPNVVTWHEVSILVSMYRVCGWWSSLSLVSRSLLFPFFLSSFLPCAFYFVDKLSSETP